MPSARVPTATTVNTMLLRNWRREYCRSLTRLKSTSRLCESGGGKARLGQASLGEVSHIEAADGPRLGQVGPFEGRALVAVDESEVLDRNAEKQILRSPSPNLPH